MKAIYNLRFKRPEARKNFFNRNRSKNKSKKGDLGSKEEDEDANDDDTEDNDENDDDSSTNNPQDFATNQDESSNIRKI